MTPLAVAVLVAAAYLVGSVPFGVLVARRVAGVDPRQAGSGNIGAANVLRTSGRAAGALTLLLDAAKGAAPALVARHLDAPPGVLAATGLAAIAGHVFPVWLRLRGGKGVATACGAFLVMTPVAAGAAVVAWVVTFGLWRVASLASLVASAFLPAFVFLYDRDRPALVVVALVTMVLIVHRHRGNLRRLVEGKEGRL
jgi:glycerol-3-phosphate acyltransferase PlsY